MNDEKEVVGRMAAVDLSCLTDIESRWFEAAIDYINGTWLTLEGETRSSVTATLSGVLSPLRNPPFDEIMGRRSSLSLEEIVFHWEGFICPISYS